MGKKERGKLKTKTELKKKVTTQEDALETALDYIERLQIERNQLESELAECESNLGDEKKDYSYRT